MQKWLKIFLLLLIPLILLLSCIHHKHNKSEAKSAPASRPPSLLQTEMEIEAAMKTLPAKTFAEYLSYAHPGPIIPGLFQGAIPQGLAYLPQANRFLVSNYMFDGRTAALTLIAASPIQEDTQETRPKTIWIYNHDGSRHRGHMGGVAVSKSTVWIASSAHFYRMSLSDILNAENGADLKLPKPLSTEVTCSTAAYSQGVLYIGEFRSSDGSYSTPESHAFSGGDGHQNQALMAAFKLDGATDPLSPLRIDESQIDETYVYPDFFISIPDEVQGAAFIRDHIVLSRSYGRTNNSRLSVYKSPLNETPDHIFTFPNGRTVPVFLLDDTRHYNTISSPPMTEGITIFTDTLALLFESAADKYRCTSRYPQDRIHIISAEITKEN